MTDNQNVGKIWLRKNEDKREGKKDPDYRGSGKVNGQDVWANGWLDNDKDQDGNFNGKKVISVSFTKKVPKNTMPQKEDDGWGL